MAAPCRSSSGSCRMKVSLDIEVRKVFLPLFQDPTRFSVVVAHRRCGKTVAACQKLISAALDKPPQNARYAYIAPLRHQAKTVAWDLIKRMTKDIPKRIVNESELRIDFELTNSRISLYGSDNPDALRGGYFDGVVLDEVAQMPPDTWTHVVRPMLADRKGWAIFIGTPQGKGPFFELWDNAEALDGWSRLMLRSGDTGLIDAEELADAKATMSPEAYDQEFECSFTAAIRGAYYGQVMEQAEKDGRVLPIDYDPSVSVTTGWDIGMRDATAIWIMMPYRGNAWAAIDYFESSGVGVDYYAAWLREQPYRYYRHFAPHDIANQDWGTVGGLNRKEVARSHGISFERVERAQNSKVIAEQINAVRLLIPRIYFHHDDTPRGQRVARGRLALSLYRQDYNERLGALSANPVHGWESHAADALRTFASVREEERRAGMAHTGDFDPSVRINIRGTSSRGNASGRSISRSSY